MAIENEDRNMAILLFNHGTIFDICQSRCSNLLLLEEFFEIMLSEGKINVNDTIEAEFNFNWLTYERSVQPLHEAVFAARFNLVKKLVNLGANVNKELESRRTPLHLALMSPRNEFKSNITKILLDCGSDVNAVDYEDYTPIFYAETDTLLEILIVRGANLNHYSHINDCTPLSNMISKRLSKCVEVLLWHGAEVNKRESDERAILERNLC
ncbi:ankyrin repeat and SOCS box protein 5-like [Belonocnema kinseyi]|uniref:ankyrin repeat and SOCS box protein 5-like n=1 Tax=Belonocnema kinseyi TaxID=2817044 RepID=UPI00143DD77A|nr:ankyrin repeat and SOCS box protein 5-like [Belonocnema kinseyi]